MNYFRENAARVTENAEVIISFYIKIQPTKVTLLLGQVLGLLVIQWLFSKEEPPPRIMGRNTTKVCALACFWCRKEISKFCSIAFGYGITIPWYGNLVWREIGMYHFSHLDIGHIKGRIKSINRSAVRSLFILWVEYHLF